MSDIFREVEEEVRRERAHRLWKQYGDYVIAAVAVIIVGVAGWQLWLRYQASRNLEASAAYAQAMSAAASGAASAADDFAKISATAPRDYAALARLARADVLASQGKTADAIAAYKAVIDEGKKPLDAIARVRTGWLIADTAKAAELQALLGPTTGAGSAWAYMAREIIAYSEFRRGEIADAGTRYQALADDAQAPETLRQRARAMAAFAKSGGGKDIGAVPPVVMPAPTATDGVPPGMAAPAAAPGATP